MTDSFENISEQHKQNPEALVGLFSDKIAAGVKEALSVSPWSKLKDILPGSDPYEVMEAYHEQAEQVYEEYGRGYWEVDKETFVGAVHDWMEQEISRLHLKPVDTERGGKFVNSRVVKSVEGREKREEQELSRKELAEKVHAENILKLTRRSHQKNKQLYPALGELEFWSPSKTKQLEEFLDSYQQKYSLSQSSELGVYWLRAVGAFLLQNDLKLQDDGDFVKLAEKVAGYWSVDPQLYKFGLKKIISRRRAWREQVAPQYTKLSPDELTKKEHWLNKKYAKDTHRVPYCLHKYYYVRHIMEHGTQKQLLWQELIDRMDKEIPEEEVSEGEQLTFHDQYIHFPAPPKATSSKDTGVGFVEAVDYLFKIEHQLTAKEKEILLELFYRYNYYFHYIKPLDKKYHEQKRKDYLNTKERQHKEKMITEQMDSEPNLFTSHLYLKEELIEAITHRIERK